MPRGEEPRAPGPTGPCPPAAGSPAWGMKDGASLPYRARCCRASRSRRPSSLIVLGLIDRSDLLEDISARRPTGVTMRTRSSRTVAYFDCIAAPGGSCVALVHVPEPFSSLQRRRDRHQNGDRGDLGGPGGPDSAGSHRSSVGWQLEQSEKGRSRSLNGENHADDVLDYNRDMDGPGSS